MTPTTPDREDPLPDEGGYPTKVTPVAPRTAVVARVDRVRDDVPPWTRPVNPDYSWDPAAKPTIPTEGSQVELGGAA